MRSAATSLWAEPAVENRPLRGRRDWVLAAMVMATLVFEAVLRRDLVWPPVALGLGCALAVAVLLRRTHPLTAVALAFGGFAAVDVTAAVAGAEPVVLYSGAVVLVLAYSLFRWGAGREAAVGLGIMATGFVASVATDFTGVGDTIGGAGVLLFAAALGVAIRSRSSARERLVERAKFHERAELARELHDTVAHHVSAIAIQAQAGLFLARSSSSLSGATEALEIIDREAAQTLAEMRSMVGALRDRQNAPVLTPQRRITDLEGLATSSTDSLRVEVGLSGELTDLPPALEAALYRVAQESVTNAQRHAHQPTRVDVKVEGNARDVQMTVSDDGAPTTTARNPPGYGLVGMAERVALLGGSLTAGPRPDRGWVVRAILPRRGTAT